MKKLIYLIVVIGALALIVAGCGLLTVPPSEESELDSKANPECTTIQDGTLFTSDGEVITTGYDKWGYNYQAHMFNGYYCDAYRDAEWCQEWKDVGLMMKWNDAWLSNKDCDGDGLLDRHYNYDSYSGSGAWLTNHQWGSYKGECWSFIDDWVLEFYLEGSTHAYVHDMTVTDDSCESFSGTGAYPSGGPYTITWTVTGVVDDSQLDMIIKYNSSTYKVNAVGTIAEDGTVSGDWTSNTGQAGTWKSTMGTALCEWDYFVKIVAAPADATNVGGVWYAVDGIEIGPVIWGAFAIIQEVENDLCAGISGLQYSSPCGPGLGKWEGEF